MAVPHQSLPEAVCQQLLEAILEERWRKTLPGIRVLRDEFQVSNETMMLALRLLEKEGYLHPASPGKPRSINQEMVSPAKTAPKKKSAPVIMVIAQRNEVQLTETDCALCSHIRKLCQAQNFVHRHVEHRHIMRAMGAKTMDLLVEQNPADVYVLLGAHPQCSKAMKKLGVSTVYVGGEQVKGCTPRISYALQQMCELALAQMVSLGHRKISVMLPEGLNSGTKKESPGEIAMGKLFQSHKLPFSTYNCPRWGKTKADFNQALEQLFSVTPPTALILGDVIHATRVLCFLMKHKLSYPDDVSIILLDEAHELHEYEPPISHIRGNIPAFAKSIMSSVRKKLLSQPDADLIITPTKLVVTGSIGEV